jgi:hypothetical protein
VSPEYSKYHKIERFFETLKVGRLSCFDKTTIVMDVEKKFTYRPKSLVMKKI